ncbi:hypothetical protein V6N11_049773 [Hibiscus sabdariffa]|uniref:Profilin n=1 Tax=Hibiscus sabdariffa TaxID=183260 RepID=A0ABR2T7X8_9ROSI
MSQEVSVESPRAHSSTKRDVVVSPYWHANQLWETYDCAASDELGLDIEQVPVSVAERDSHVVNTLGNTHASVEKSGVVLGKHGVVPQVAFLGSAGASMVLVIGSVQGGARKDKSVNSLVEALGLSAQ